MRIFVDNGPNGLAEVNAGAKFNARRWRQTSVTLDH
jgi:hypothetical protein